MDKNPVVFLLHIQDAIQLIEEYASGYSYQRFVADQKTQDAIIRQLEIIGEATSNLESSFKQAYPNIPWREISDFRNVLAHEYWNVDTEIVWEALQKGIPQLKTAISAIISSDL